jgi:MYXO-CTERM domain-containing protein
MKSLVAATAAAVVCASSQAALIYSTNFDSYTNGNISSQTAWLGTGGSWAVTGSMNSGQLAGSIVANPSAGGTGKSVRLTTEKWNFGGRTKVWLDLANSGKWAAASTGANSATKVLRAELDVFVATGQPVNSSFGMMIGDTSASYSAGLMISNTGQVWTASNGYAAANRTNRTTAALDTWHKFMIDWNTVSGNAKAYLNGVLIADYTPTNKSGVYAVQLFTTTDNGASGSTTNNGFGFADNFSVSSVPTPGAAALVGLAGLLARRRRA